MKFKVREAFDKNLSKMVKNSTICIVDIERVQEKKNPCFWG